jgi:putative transposase
MANTYTQCYFHLVFVVKNRDALIKKEWKCELEKYITGIVQNHRLKMLAIGAIPDHLHILIGYNTNQLIPDQVEEIKTPSNSWIKVGKLNLSLNGKKAMGHLHIPAPKLTLWQSLL